MRIKRNPLILFPSFLTSLLITAQLAWGLPPTAADALRPTIQERVESGLEEALHEPSRPGKKSGLEERPKVNWTKKEKLAAYFKGLSFTLPKGIPEPDSETKEEMAAAVVKELEKSQRSFKDAWDFRRRMKGIVRKEVWDAISHRLEYGISRRAFMRWGATAVGTTALVGTTAAWILSSPKSQAILVLQPHGAPIDLEPILEELKVAEGSSQKVIFVGEQGPPLLENIRQVFPEVYAQLNKEKLDELIKLYLSQGEEAVEKDPLGHRLKGLNIRNRQNPGNLLANWRKDPPLLEREYERRMKSAHNMALDRYLVQHPELEVVWEQPPLISFLYSLRRDLAKEEAILAFYRDKDEKAFFLAMSDRLRFYDKGTDTRDEALLQELFPNLLKKNPGTKLIVRFGSDHLKDPQQTDRLKELGFVVTLKRYSYQQWEDRILDPYRKGLIENPQASIPTEIQPLVRRHPTFLAVYSILRNANLPVAEADQLAETATIHALTPAEFDELTGVLREKLPQLQRLAETGGVTLEQALTVYMVVWLNEQGKMKSEIQEKLPPDVRSTTLEELEENLRAKSTQGKKGARLEEQPARPKVNRLGEEALDLLRERWEGLRSGMEELPFVVFGRSVASPEVQILAGLEERFLVDWEPVETAVELVRRGVYRVEYLGGLEEAQRFKRVAKAALIETTIHDAGEESPILFLKGLLGIPPQAVTSDLEEMIEDLAPLSDV